MPTPQRSHEQAQVEGARVDEQSFEDVGVPAQMRPPHAPGLVAMGVGSFEAVAALALQGSAPCASDASAIGVHRVSRRGLARPAPSAAMGFGNVRAQVQRRQIHQDLVAVVPLVGDDFLGHAGVLVCRRGHSFEVLGGRRHRVRDGRGIPLVGALDRHPDDGAGLQVDRMLGLVREVRAAVLHLRDARVGVVRMPPVGVAALLRAGPIQPRQIRPRRRCDARCRREPREKLLIGLARVASHDAPQGGVRRQGRGINADRLAPDQVGGCQHLQDPGEDRAGRLHIDQPAGSRNRRVLGRRFVETQAEEAAQGERIRRPPCYATFRVDAFEVPAQQQPEVRAWRQTRPAHGLRIERGALGFDEFVERVRVEHLIQPQVERVPAGSGQFIGSNPQSRRPCAILASTHRHAGSVVRQIDRVDSLLATGC